jgi:hypothetical protein
VAYAKYVAIKSTTQRLKKMRKEGTWNQKMPTNDEIVEVFMSKSAYFRSHQKIFPAVPNFPLMEKWLLVEDDAPTDAAVWGQKRQTFDNLKAILAAHSAAGKKEKGGPPDRKGKKRHQEDPSSDSSEKVVKDRKGKGRQTDSKKAGSSKYRQ